MKYPKMLFSTSEEIRAFRKKTGLRQDLFWAQVGITQSGGSRYENGRNVPLPVQILLTIVFGPPTRSSKMTEALRAWKT